jgi:glycosyltransferase involved in cell wall biosynthesis
MKIVVVSTTIMTCPPAGYSGLEMLAWQHAVGLAKRGHSVLFVTPRGSATPPGVELHETTLGESEQLAYSGYWHKLPNYDVVIDHSWQKWAYMLKVEGKLKAPVLGVLHAPAHTMYQSPPPVTHPCLVAISADQASHASELWGVMARVAHNGVDLDFYKPTPGVHRTDRYLFLARMSRIKGPHIAVDLARKLRFPLDLVGDDRLTGEPEYSQRLIAQAKNNIAYHGGKPRAECVKFFSQAKALLHMNQHFREPFGLAPVEAQACGLPVIAFDNGAMRETIKHGLTGFIVKSPDEVEGLIRSNAVASIDSQTCIDWAKQFSVERMIETYEKLALEALETGGW